MSNIPEVSTLDFLLQTREIYKNPLPFHRENFKKLGYTFKITPKPGLKIHFTCDERIVKHMLQKNQRNYEKSPLQTDDLGKYIGHGLLTENGEKWRANRKLIQPAFYKKSLMVLLETMNDTIEKELSRIQPEQELDVFPVFNDLAFKVVAKSLFDLPDIDEAIDKLQHITEEAQKMLIKELRIPWMKWYFDREWLAGKNSVPHHIRMVEEARDILREIIRDRKSSQAQHDDLLNLLLHSTYEDGSKMDEEQLIDEILVLFIAGHETTANALSFAVQLLAHNPETQEKAIAELRGNKGDSIYECLVDLPYLKQCVEETLRLYPPAYVTDRVTLEDDLCEEIELKAGSTWLISFYELHRREDLWREPETFDPERFSPENAKNHRDYYFPFGAGPRMCIGNNFAIYEMVMVLAQLLQRYKIQPVQDEIEIFPLITLKPKNAVVKFQSR
ncbi:cytochrome P450 [Nonlabens spongiae]|uniref:Cytochrome P450 n=1 Tax=Nonlabens spongiae TaxID=331648 RepID=A0A1W6MM83_9FLAO|nr:cytochrome P450 [Nonlabens spongiae]ARN78609.1 cytochrome P450 [Nonlabens spongiae]